MSITIAGLGVKNADHFTIETISRLKESKKVYILGPPSEAVKSKLSEYGILNYKHILHLYHDETKDQINYKRIYNFLLEEREKEGSISLLIPGHPSVGVSLTQMLKSSEGKNIDRVDILPGISSFDTMIADLAVDPLEKGSLIVDSNRLLLLDIQLDPNLDTYIYHPSAVGSSKIHLQEKKYNRLDQLQEHLERFYKSNHSIYLLHSSTSSHIETERIEIKLNELNYFKDFIHIGMTAFIPAQQLDMSSVNTEYLKQLMDIDGHN